MTRSYQNKDFEVFTKRFQYDIEMMQRHLHDTEEHIK